MSDIAAAVTYVGDSFCSFAGGLTFRPGVHLGICGRERLQEVARRPDFNLRFYYAAKTFKIGPRVIEAGQHLPEAAHWRDHTPWLEDGRLREATRAEVEELLGLEEKVIAASVAEGKAESLPPAPTDRRTPRQNASSRGTETRSPRQDRAKSRPKGTRAAKRARIVELLEDPEMAGWSDRELGRRAGCDHKTIAAIRRELGMVRSEPPIYRTRHGTVSKMRRQAER